VDPINWISVVSGIVGILGFVFAIWVWMRSDAKVQELQNTLDFKVRELQNTLDSTVREFRNTLQTVYETCGTVLWETRFLPPEDKDARLSQLDKAIGLVSAIRTLASRYSESTSHGPSELELLIERGVLWTEEMVQRLERSAEVREVWLITHDLEPDLSSRTAGKLVGSNLKDGKSYKYFFPEDLEDADAKIWQLRINIGATPSNSPVAGTTPSNTQVEFFPVVASSEVHVSTPGNVILFFKDNPFYTTDLVFQEVILTKVARRGLLWQEHDPKHARQVLGALRTEVQKQKKGNSVKPGDQSAKKEIPPSTT
jgi:hypothetical protein